MNEVQKTKEQISRYGEVTTQISQHEINNRNDAPRPVVRFSWVRAYRKVKVKRRKIKEHASKLQREEVGGDSVPHLGERFTHEGNG